MNALIQFLCASFVFASTCARRAESYFPPPERRGGWRTLVPVNATPSQEQKQAVCERAGLDWDKLAEAWRYTASFKTPNSLLIIRHGWIAGEWVNFTNARGIASCTKSLTALAMAKLFDMSDSGQLPKRMFPFNQKTFQGRIAYSCDGNHNDRDDRIASPLTLAIIAEASVICGTAP